MSEIAPWEALLKARFPAYLLPRSKSASLSEEAAACLLERLGGDPEQLDVLRAASAIAPHARLLRELALRDIDALTRELSPRAELDPRSGEGPLEGRIDVAATLKRRLEGRVSHVVTRPRRPRLSRPEDALLKATTARLIDALARLRAARLLEGRGAFEGLDACEEPLRRALSSTPLRDVIDEPISASHEQAAMSARRPGYAAAATIHRALREAFDAVDTTAIARAIAEGALLPLDPPARFELAVLLRLLEAIELRLTREEPGRWSLVVAAILPDRSDVACFEREDGASIRAFYNQTRLPPGPHDRGAQRYLGHESRLRPDITLLIETGGGSPAPARAAVVECKLSADPEYIALGYRQAALYRHEFAPALTGWPKAILVSSCSLPGTPSREDDVIAVGWDRWVPEDVLDGLLDGLTRSSATGSEAPCIPRSDPRSRGRSTSTP